MRSRELAWFAIAASRVLGWTYFLCWSLSFYPQPVLNWRRRSTLGLAIDFTTCNLVGFLALSVSQGVLLYSPTIRSQYAHRYPVSPEPTVRFNDFLFAAHGAVLSVVVYSQFWARLWGFKVGARQRASGAALGIVGGNLAGIAIVAGIVLAASPDGGYDAASWAWIDVIYAIGFTKIVMTIVKYIPQVYANYRQQSTEGWSIGQIVLDVVGGLLSLAQLVLDSWLQADWSGISGNPVKLLLGNITLVFDAVFLAQHYVLYRHAGAGAAEGEVDGDRAGGDGDGNERRRLLGGET